MKLFSTHSVSQRLYSLKPRAIPLLSELGPAASVEPELNDTNASVNMLFFFNEKIEYSAITNERAQLV